MIDINLIIAYKDGRAFSLTPTAAASKSAVFLLSDGSSAAAIRVIKSYRTMLVFTLLLNKSQQLQHVKLQGRQAVSE
jgi:hypothetical protein